MIMNQKSVPFIDPEITNTVLITAWSEEKSTMAISSTYLYANTNLYMAYPTIYLFNKNNIYQT